MVFWIAVFIGAVLAVVGTKKGFFVMWAGLFNILVSIYLAIMLTPFLIEALPEYEYPGYHCAACLIGIAGITFAILQTIATTLLTGHVDISFPKLFDGIGAAVLGFISGYLVTAFVFLLICIMPFSSLDFMKTVGGREKLSPSSVAPIVTACNFIQKASLHTCKGTPAIAIDRLFEYRDSTQQNPSAEDTDSDFYNDI